MLGPLAVFKQNKYFFDNFSLGSLRSEFRGRPGFFFGVLYALGFAVFVLLGVLIAGVSILAALTRTSGESATSTTTTEEVPEEFALLFALIPLVSVYVIFLVLFGVWAVLSRNYCWNNAVLKPGPDEVRFESRLGIRRYLWISLSNIVLTIVTLGLFAPWAAVRMFRYRTSCLSVYGATSLDDMVAEISAEPNAMGDAASDLFDFDFGL